jgi:SAM-dependent methyltransferase
VTQDHCRLCGEPLHETFIDLGMSPLSNAFLPPARANQAETFYPLHAYACTECHLVQLAQFETPQAIFGDYLYFSSFSESWLKHAELYTARMIERFGLVAADEVVEVASNDGYLLQFFQKAGIGILGVEPAANVAEVAIGRGIPTDVAFFGRATALRLRSMGHAPRAIVANNVLAHVPDLNDFIAGMKILLAPQGVITVEFPHLQHLIDENQFDTIYHEHFSYFSLLAVRRAFAAHDLDVFDVEELTTHGGSLRLYVCDHESKTHEISASVAKLLQRELDAGYGDVSFYRGFARRAEEVKFQLLEFLITARRAGKTVVGYGAPAKGNTLLNYCGIRSDLLRFTVDLSPHKQGLLLPGSHIPVFHPDHIASVKPDYVLILPWNLREEIMHQMAAIRDWGGKFVIPVPALQVLE